MAKSKTKENCFIIMPITTPTNLVERYKGDEDHFTHVLEHLFIPALESAGFKPISPKSAGSDVIQAEIIKQLSSCELVLCDMSILNPNRRLKRKTRSTSTSISSESSSAIMGPLIPRVSEIIWPSADTQPWLRHLLR